LIATAGHPQTRAAGTIVEAGIAASGDDLDGDSFRPRGPSIPPPT
jgi:hypothetical protein